MADFQLGDRVTITGTVKKVHRKRWTLYEEADRPYQYGGWQGKRYFDQGVIVGRRTVQNGKTYHDWDEGPTFIQEPGTAKRVWLVAYNLNYKPVMCFPHQIERMNDA